MPCERAEQTLSRSTLEDTGAPALMEIMMAGPPEDICLLVSSPQSPGTRGGPEPGAGAQAVGTHEASRAASRRGLEPEPRGHVAVPELPQAGSGSSSHGDTWRPRSCPELGAGARAAGTRGSLGAALSREAGAVILI
jgi:hypothetical protein